MTLLDQIKSLEGSKMAQDIATAFLVGFACAAVKQLLPLVDPTSFGASLFHIAQAARNQLWLYNFFDSSFTSAIGVSIGLKIKSAFDNVVAKNTGVVTDFRTLPTDPKL